METLLQGKMASCWKMQNQQYVACFGSRKPTIVLFCLGIPSLAVIFFTARKRQPRGLQVTFFQGMMMMTLAHFPEIELFQTVSAFPELSFGGKFKLGMITVQFWPQTTSVQFFRHRLQVPCLSLRVLLQTGSAKPQTNSAQPLTLSVQPWTTSQKSKTGSVLSFDRTLNSRG